MIDEEKLKLLLTALMRDVFTCLPANAYTASVWEDIQTKIAEANLLTWSKSDDTFIPSNKDWF